MYYIKEFGEVKYYLRKIIRKVEKDVLGWKYFIYFYLLRINNFILLYIKYFIFIIINNFNR